MTLRPSDLATLQPFGFPCSAVWRSGWARVRARVQGANMNAIIFLERIHLYVLGQLMWFRCGCCIVFVCRVLIRCCITTSTHLLGRYCKDSPPFPPSHLPNFWECLPTISPALSLTTYQQLYILYYDSTLPLLSLRVALCLVCVLRFPCLVSAFSHWEWLPLYSFYILPVSTILNAQ